MKRREFMVAGAGAVPASLIGSVCRSAETAAPVARPNILWIMTDQQPADALSCAGNTNLHTPAMDRLAADGVRFELSYCANPICVPSRTAMMTGHMSHETGVMFNMNSFQVLQKSLGKHMKQAGYETAYIGKWHIPMDCADEKWYGLDLMMEGTAELNDRYIPKHVNEFLCKEHDKPFFLVASLVNPHDICEYARKLSGFPEKDTGLWNGPIPPAPPPHQCPELPANFAIPENEPDIIREHQTWLPFAYPSIHWSEETWRQYRWALNRLTERVDSEIEKILDTLRVQELDRNTIVVLVSDHGDGNAEHRWNQKTLLYDSVARVPLIISGPGIAVPGRTDRTHLVSTGLDLFPTFCDYAGIVPPDSMVGASLRPLLEGRSAEWREQVVSECDLYRRYGLSGGVQGRMLRTAEYKYIVYSAGKLREQLFDMHKDPGEMNNLVVDPAYRSVLQEHRKRLAVQIKETKDCFVVPDVAYDGWTFSC
jgi:choline-sulfatase